MSTSLDNINSTTKQSIGISDIDVGKTSSEWNLIDYIVLDETAGIMRTGIKIK